MARIAGVDIPGNKRGEIALTYIFGIGRPTAKDICEKAGIDVSTKTDVLSESDVNRLREVIDADHLVEGDKRKEIGLQIKMLMDMGCYRGLRHRRGLPVRGQRTHTNARTRKGKKKTVAGKKK